jgi:integrase
MTLRFSRLDRPAIRRLAAGQKITEHGITAERLTDGDIRWSVNVMVDGQRIHRVIGRESEGVTRTQAEEFIEKARSDARENRLSLPRGRKLHLTFRAAADIYLKKLREIGGKDYGKNDQHLRLHLNPYFGSMRLDQISVFTIQKFQVECRRKELAEATVNRVLATYRRMSRRLASWKVIPAPLAMVKLQQEQNARDYVISAHEECRLLEAAKADAHPYIWLFIKFGLATSLRHSEMLSARFENFDPEKRRLRVQVKGGRLRNQPLGHSICGVVLKELEMAADPRGWIFPSSRSKSGHIESMEDPFARCVKAAGMDPAVVVPHVMRHTAITRLAASGADIKTIQAFSGHLSVGMVLRYAHAQDHIIDSALDRLDGGTVVEHQRAQAEQKS